MLALYRLLLFQIFLFPVAVLSQILSFMVDTPLDFYGVFLLTAVRGLRKAEALMCLLLIGLFLDVSRVETHLWGWTSLVLTGTLVLFYSDAWRNIFTARPELWACLLNVFLQCIFLCGPIFVYGIPFSYVTNYCGSILFSMLCVYGLIRPLFYVQEKYLG